MMETLTDEQISDISRLQGLIEEAPLHEWTWWKHTYKMDLAPDCRGIYLEDTKVDVNYLNILSASFQASNTRYYRFVGQLWPEPHAWDPWPKPPRKSFFARIKCSIEYFLFFYLQLVVRHYISLKILSYLTLFAWLCITFFLMRFSISAQSIPKPSWEFVDYSGILNNTITTTGWCLQVFMNVLLFYFIYRKIIKPKTKWEWFILHQCLHCHHHHHHRYRQEFHLLDHISD